MAWFRVSLSEDEQQVVREQRELHSDPYVRRRMWTLWLLHWGATRGGHASQMQMERPVSL